MEELKNLPLHVVVAGATQVFAVHRHRMLLSRC